MNKKPIQSIIMALLLSLPMVLQSKNILDDNRPDNISDEKWLHFKMAIEEANLLPSPEGIGGPSSRFGTSVSVDGDRALVSAPFVGVYVLDYDGMNWRETAVLQANESSPSIQFGFSVSLSGNRALVSAFEDDAIGFNSGSVYVFELSAGNWSETAKLTASDAVAAEQFGYSVSLLGGRALVGANRDDDNGINSGSAYVFDLNAGNWSETAKLTASDGEFNDNFGSSVSLSDDRALIGAIGNNDSGSAYVFDLALGKWTQTTKLLANDGEPSDRFGHSVSLLGDRALVGAYGKDFSSGSAYVFELIAGSWSEVAKLTASNGTINDRFGYSVSLSSDRALIGAYQDGSGSAYVFEFTADNWSETTKLAASDGENGDAFGWSVSLSNDRALIGAYQDDDEGRDSGSAYVFDLTAGSWSEMNKLTSKGAADDQFGISVSLSAGNRALVGAYRDDDQSAANAGSAYVFELIAGSWSEVAKLTASDGSFGDQFGYSVSLSGDRALVGSIGDDDNGSESGSAYVFELIAGSWSEVAKLTASDGALGDQFGFSVSLSGDRALVGAIDGGDNGSESGSAYVFELIAGNWSEMAKLTASDDASGDQFGYSVSLSGDRALVGAYLDDDNGSNSGSAYVFDLSGGSWLETAKLTANDGENEDLFGSSVSLFGDRALVGAYLDGDNGFASGSAYVFDLTTGSWSEVAKLTASDGAFGDQFGYSVSLSGDRVLVGAIEGGDNGSESGSAYVFELIAGNWSEMAKLTASDGAFGDQFGSSVSISGARTLVGAYKNDDRGSDSGSAYVFVNDLIYRDGFDESDFISRMLWESDQ